MHTRKGGDNVLEIYLKSGNYVTCDEVLTSKDEVLDMYQEDYYFAVQNDFNESMYIPNDNIDYIIFNFGES